jgi:lipopolysaccharide transport system permease protein
MSSPVTVLDGEARVTPRVGARARQDKPTLVIEPRRGIFGLDLANVWEYRELLYFIIWRDVKVRYKQTVIGIAWVILQPLLTMLIFSAIFGGLAKIPSDGKPYPIFVFAGLLPWNLFASCVSRGGDSVVGSGGLISKVYFPRLVLPLAAALAPVLDFLVAFAVLIGMGLWFGIVPGWGVLWLPLFTLLAVLTALAVALILSGLNVRYRDVGHAIPFLVQIWMFASPVTYPVNMIPQRWRLLYSLNPMAGVIEGFRWALLGTDRPDLVVMGVSAAMVVLLLVPALMYFRHTERTFADII